MPDDLQPGDEIVFRVMGMRSPFEGEWFADDRHICQASSTWTCLEEHRRPILFRTVRREGERPGYFDARFEKIEAAIAEFKAKREPERESPDAIADRIVSDWANECGSYPSLTLRIAAAIYADRERKP